MLLARRRVAVAVRRALVPGRAMAAAPAVTTPSADVWPVHDRSTLTIEAPLLRDRTPPPPARPPARLRS
jgi:hypothetical protein